MRVLFLLCGFVASALCACIAPTKGIQIPIPGSTYVNAIQAADQPDFGVANSKITNAIIVLHGFTQPVDNLAYFCYIDGLTTAARSARFILAPEFNTVANGSAITFPKATNWFAGGTELTNKTTSFDIMDYFVKVFSDMTLYPSLTLISIVGHSGGGQFAQHYSIGMNETLYQTVNNKSITMRFGVANPSSYAFLTTSRPVSTDFGPSAPMSYPTGYCDDAHIFKNFTFQSFNTTFPLDSTGANCSQFHDWKYGLFNTPTSWYSGINFNRTEIRANYRTRNVILISGSNETCNSNISGTCPSNEGASTLDVGCEAMAQGTCRLMRHQVYWQHLLDVYSYGMKTFAHKAIVVANAAHQPDVIFADPAVQAALFTVPPRIAPPAASSAALAGLSVLTTALALFVL